MRWMLVAALAAAGMVVLSDRAEAQTLQCRQQITAEDRAACAAAELDDLDDMARFWRRQARQTEADYAYFTNRRARCDSEPECIASDRRARSLCYRKNGRRDVRRASPSIA